MYAWVPLILLVMVLSACSSQAHVQQRSRIASGERVTCRQQTPTGSHMPRVVCTSAAERAQQEREGRAMIEEEQRLRAAEDAMRQTMQRERMSTP